MFSKNAQHTAYSPFFFYPLQQLNSTSLLAPLSLPAAEVRHSGIHPAERGALYHELAAPAQDEPVGPGASTRTAAVGDRALDAGRVATGAHRALPHGRVDESGPEARNVCAADRATPVSANGSHRSTP